jgi:TetR/AcrR family transcriptional regulator, multidrug resistance operon repressor
MRTRDESKELAIRQKALEMIVRDGIEGFSMQKLAKAVGVSPATSYIYYKNKEDLIISLYEEESMKMKEATLKDFDPSVSFRQGLTLQWVNRARYCLKHTEQMYFLEQIRRSPLQQKCSDKVVTAFRNVMREFVSNAIKRKELAKLPLEVYWSVAFAPLYTLVEFHHLGRSIGGRKFVFSEKIMMETLELVLKALKP